MKQITSRRSCGHQNDKTTTQFGKTYVEIACIEKFRFQDKLQLEDCFRLKLYKDYHIKKDCRGLYLKPCKFFSLEILRVVNELFAQVMNYSLE